MDLSKVFKLIAAFFVLAALVSCGSSSDGGSSADTGRVSILVTDGVTDDFDEVNLTVEEISFLGEDDGHQTIVFKESRVINLLALQNYSDLLVTAVIPVGSYDKVRLHVSQVELVNYVDEQTTESYIAKLPANGKVDLNPRNTFDVTGDGHLIMELDVDAEKSIHIIEKGNGKLEYNFRPVVFVNIIEAVDESKLVMLDGKVMEKTDTGFQLCDAQLLEVDDTCAPVVISANTIVQNNMIEEIPAGNIVDEDIVTVLGKIGSENISALHIVIESNDEAASVLALFSGAATSPVVADDFTMETDGDNGIVPPLSPLTVSLVDGSGVRIFNKYGDVVGTDVIDTGTDVDVFGQYMAEAQLKAAFIIIDNDVNADKISGIIGAISDTGSELTVVTQTGDVTADVCVNINEAILFMLDIFDGKMVTMEITADELTVDMTIDVYGRADGSGCFAADVVLVAPVSVSPLKTPLVTGN